MKIRKKDDQYDYPNDEYTTRSIKELAIVVTLGIFACGVGIVVLIIRYADAIDNLFK